MKKLLSFLAVVLISAAASAQSVTLIFTAMDAANRHVQLNRVSITNLTKGWQETIYWPDTTLTMQNGTGISDIVGANNHSPLWLSQNNPNPFTGTTEVNLMVAEHGDVMMEITDITGRVVGTKNLLPLQGTHQFRITLATAGTYVMTARQNGQTSSVKMVCNGGGDGNWIEYTGIVEANNHSPLQTKSTLRGTTNNPFTFGDQMEYVGYATINGSEAESQRIMQAQGASQTFVLQFDVLQNHLPALITQVVNNITSSSATVGGIVTTDGGAAVFDRGICYSIIPTPTVSDNCVHIGQGTGSFSDNLTGLSPNTTYYVRAYAMNSVGTAYGNEVSFTTTTAIQLPTVITTAVNNVAQTIATCGGNVTSDGGATVTARGVCWSTSQNPTTTDSHTSDGSGTGSFTSNLTGLTSSTTYYVRAYATNSAGTSYGNEVSFTTADDVMQDGQPCPDAPTVTDIDNNTYNTVQIGQQCWMKENLRTTRYANGVNIPMGSTYSFTDPYRYAPDNDNSNVSTYGYLYNWPAVMGNSSSSSANPSGVQGICPNGWHVPSNAEWTQLTDYVGSQTDYQCDNNSAYIAKALASETGWNANSGSCAVGNNPSSNNATGFSALPAGSYYGYYDNFGYYANLWSATEYNVYNAYYRYLHYDNANVGRSYGYKGYARSVRCVRD